MSRSEQIAVVEEFFAAVVGKDLTRLPVEPDYTAESPLTGVLRGPAAVQHLERVAANVTSIRVLQHIVEGEFVATLFEEDTVHGVLPVFGKFHVVSGRIREARVFYDPRLIADAK